MSGQNHNFTPGRWYGVYDLSGDQLRYLAKVMPVGWTLHPEDAWMTHEVTDAWEWLRQVHYQDQIGMVFRCTVARSQMGGLSVIGHRDVVRRTG